MTKPNNAAQVAVQAAACLSCASLPTTRQAMLIALTMVQKTLGSMEICRLHDAEWDERDVDVDYAARLTAELIAHLREALPDDVGIFADKWFTAASVINLCETTFSRKNCLYYRLLTGLQEMFCVLFSVVEFVDGEAQHA